MADDRTYIKLHDGMPENPKVVGLNDKEFRTYVEVLCYCGRNLTDGTISLAAARRLAPPRVWATLTANGLIQPCADGYRVHDYLEHQRSAEQVKELKEKRREAGKRGGNAKAKALASARGRASDLVKQTASKSVAETESLTYVRDQTESPTGEAPQNEPNAGAVIAAWIDGLNRRPPSRVIGHVSKQVKELLDDSFSAADIGAALEQMSTKGLNPATLPSLVNDIVNRPRTRLAAVADRRLTAAELENVLGMDVWSPPAPPSNLTADEQDDWIQAAILAHADERQQKARERMGRAS